MTPSALSSRSRSIGKHDVDVLLEPAAVEVDRDVAHDEVGGGRIAGNDAVVRRADVERPVAARVQPRRRDDRHAALRAAAAPARTASRRNRASPGSCPGGASARASEKSVNRAMRCPLWFVMLSVEAAQHHRRDASRARAVGIRLAHQPQALNAGDQVARERPDVGRRCDLPARLAAGERVAEQPLDAFQRRAAPARRSRGPRARARRRSCR